MDLLTSEREVPLVVDLDGTLIRSDLLVESFFALLGTAPLKALRAVAALRRGKASLKASLAEHATVDLDALPFNAAVLEFLAAERARGRRIYLASASDRRHVEPVAAHLGLFDGVFASEGTVNLAGSRKAALLCRRFGERGFDYVADARVDLQVWEKARRAITVDCTPSLLRALRRHHPDPVVLSARRPALRDYTSALRVRRWAKNALMAVPALAAGGVAPGDALTLLAAMLAFSLVASALYLVNDLTDLGEDRGHAAKRARPFAAGSVPILHGLVLAPALALAGGAMAAAISLPFLGAVLLYAGLSLGYSIGLKRVPVLCLLTRTALDTTRIIAGAAALDLPLPPWLLVPCAALLLGLAWVRGRAARRGARP